MPRKIRSTILALFSSAVFFCPLFSNSQNPPKTTIAYIPIKYELLNDSYKDLKLNLDAKLKSFNSLLALFLANGENTVMVEREYLDMIVRENNINLKELENTSPTSAEIIVKGRIFSADENEYVIEIQASPKDNTAKKESFKITVNPENPRDAALECSLKILKFAGEKNEMSPDIEKEAAYYHKAASVYSAQHKYHSAFQSYKIAWLLTPENTEYLRDYHRLILMYPSSETSLFGFRGGSWGASCRLKNDQYMEVVSALSDVIDMASSSNYLYREIFIGGMGTYGFLAIGRDTGKLKFSDVEWEKVSDLRKKLKPFFETLKANNKNKYQNNFIQQCMIYSSPLFFDNPKDFFPYLKPLLFQEPVPWEDLRNEYFSGFKHWGKINTWRQYWEKLLLELEDEKLMDLQYNARVALCFVEKSFVWNPEKANATKYLENLLAWLKKDENMNWVITDTHRAKDLFHQLLRSGGIKNLNPDEQEVCYKEICMEIFARTPLKIDEISGFLYDARDYFEHRFKNIKNPSDKDKIIEFLDMTMKITGKHDPKNYAERNNVITDEVWYNELTNKKTKKFPEFPGVRNGTMIFDYTGTDNPGFYNMGIYYKHPLLWFAWPVKTGVEIVRIDLNTGKHDLFNIDIPKNEYNVMNITEYNGFLCLSTLSKILLIPLSVKPPYLNIASMKMLGPQIGNSEMGRMFPNTKLKQVSALIAGKEYLYICLYHSFNNLTSGDIYKWKPGMTDCEILSSSESLQMGELNDCAPYKVLTGFYNKKSGKELFFLIEVFNSKNKSVGGIWEHDPITNEWKHIDKIDFGPLNLWTTIPAGLTSEEFFLFSRSSGKYFKYDLEKSTFTEQVVPSKEVFRCIDSVNGKFSWAIKNNGSVGYVSKLYKISDDGKNAEEYLAPQDDNFEIDHLIPTVSGLVVLFHEQRPRNPPKSFAAGRFLVYLIDENKP